MARTKGALRCLRLADAYLPPSPGAMSTTTVVDRFDLYFLLVANPDGYSFSFSSGNRFWRKNRAPNAGSFCVGTGAPLQPTGISGAGDGRAAAPTRLRSPPRLAASPPRHPLLTSRAPPLQI